MISDDIAKTTVEIALQHVGKYAEDAAKWKYAFEDMCSYYLSLMEGDTHLIDDAHALMRKHNIVDEDGYRIEEDAENRAKLYELLKDNV